MSESDTRPVVLHVLHTMRTGGAEVLALHLIQKFNHHYRFMVVAIDEAGNLEEAMQVAGAETFLIKRAPGIDWSLADRLAAFIDQHQVRIIHAHQYTPWFYCGVAKRKAQRSPALIFHEHGRHYPDQKKLKRSLYNAFRLMPVTTEVLAVGEFIKSAVAKNENVSSKRIRVIHNGINIKRFPVCDQSLAHAKRMELEIEVKQPVVMQVGRFVDVKDHVTSLKAIDFARKNCPDLLMLYAGEGHLLDDIKSMAREMKLMKHVRFLGNRNDITHLWQAVDLCLLTSKSEGISVSLLEAMACGVPVVATKVGGNAEVVEHGVTGMLAPRGDHRALARHIYTFLTDPDLCFGMGRAGRKRVEDKFAEVRMHKEITELYQRLFKKH